MLRLCLIGFANRTSRRHSVKIQFDQLALIVKKPFCMLSRRTHLCGYTTENK